MPFTGIEEQSKEMQKAGTKILNAWIEEGFEFYNMDIRSFYHELDPKTHVNSALLFLQAIQTDLTQEFFLDLYNMLRKDDNVIIRIAGRTGSAKSSVGMSIALLFSDLFKVPFSIQNNMGKNTSDAIRKVREAFARDQIKKAWFIKDDIKKKERIGGGSKRVKAESEDIENNVRQWSTNFVNIHPKATAEDHTDKFVIECKHWFNPKTKMSRCLVYFPDQEFPSGFIDIKTDLRGLPIWKEYMEVFKQQNIKEAIEGTASITVDELEGVAREWMNRIEYLECTNDDQRLITLRLGTKEKYEMNEYRQIMGRIKTLRKIQARKEGRTLREGAGRTELDTEDALSNRVSEVMKKHKDWSYHKIYKYLMKKNVDDPELSERKVRDRYEKLKVLKRFAKRRNKK